MVVWCVLDMLEAVCLHHVTFGSCTPVANGNTTAIPSGYLLSYSNCLPCVIPYVHHHWITTFLV